MKLRRKAPAIGYTAAVPKLKYTSLHVTILASALALGCSDDPASTMQIAPVIRDAGADAFELVDAGTEPEPDAQPEPEPDAQPAPEPDAQPAPEPDAQPEPGPDAQPEPEPEPQPEPPPDGFVISVVLTEQPQVPQATLNALVQLAEELPQGDGCTVSRVDPGDPAPPIAPQFDVGPLTVGGVNAGSYTLEFAGDRYRDPATPDDLFRDGAALTLSAPAGALPAFEVGIAAPAEVRVSQPSQLQAVDGRGDLDLRWTAGDGDIMIISVFPTEPFSVDPDEGNWIFCGVPDTGSFTIAGDDLAQLSNNLGFGSGALVAITRTKSTSQAVGGGTAALTATSSFGVAITFD